MIRTEHLHYSYGNGRPVLQDISIAFPQGQVTALLGCNGAGKSTLMRCLLGLSKNYTGNILLKEKELKTLSPAQLGKYMAYIPQHHYPAFSYSTLEMVLMGTTGQLKWFASPGPRQRAEALEAMQTLGIADLAQRAFDQLSGGEQQLVLFARALAQKTPVLVMDEPTASLDYSNQHLVLEQIRRLSRAGYTVIVSLHDPQHVLSYADQVAVLRHGRLLDFGKTDEVLQPVLLEQLYGLKTLLTDTPGGRQIVCLPKGEILK